MLLFAAIAFLLLAIPVAVCWFRMRKKQNQFRYIEQELDTIYASVREIARGNFTSKARISEINRKQIDSVGLADKISDLVDEVNSITTQPLRRLVYAGADSYLEGQACGKLMAEAIGESGEVAVIEWNDKRSSTKLRRKGFEQYMEDHHPAVHLLGYKETEAVSEKTYQAVLALLNEYPQIKGLYISEGITPPDAARALRDHHKEKTVAIVTHDITGEIAEGIRSGSIRSTLSQNLYSQGFDPVLILFNYLAAGYSPPSPRHLTELDPIDASNLSEYWHPQHGFLLDAKTRRSRPQPIQKAEKPIKILFFGEERFTIHQQIKKGVLDAREILREWGAEIIWKVYPGCDQPGGIMPPVEQVEEFIIQCIAVEKPEAIVVKASYERIVGSLNRMEQQGISIATYNAEPLGVRGLFAHINSESEALLTIARELSEGSCESEQAMSQINQSMQEVADSALELTRSATDGKVAITEMDESVELLDQGAVSQSEAIENTRTLTGELEDSIEDIRSQLKQLDKIKESIRSTAEGMDKLRNMSGAINQIASTMEDVAEQTGLLSMNAAIEAAHAGEQGKGFGVVSSEIRKLAEKSSVNTREIEAITRKVTDHVLTSAKAIDRSKGILESHIKELAEVSDGIMQRLSEFETSFDQVIRVTKNNRESGTRIAGNTSHVYELIDTVVSISEENSASAEEISATTSQITAQTRSMALSSRHLNQMALSLQGLIHQFRTDD